MKAGGGELERIVGEAVRTLVTTPARTSAPAGGAPTKVPLLLRGGEDVALLLAWFRRLCADESWRLRFLNGQLELSIQVAPPSPEAAAERVPAGAAAIAPVETPRRVIALEDHLITEAVLRRHAGRDDVVALAARAVITPTALDYARTAGIRLERK